MKQTEQNLEAQENVTENQSQEKSKRTQQKKRNSRASPCNSSTYCSAKVLRPDLRIDIPAAGATRRAFAFGACGERGFGGGELVIVSFLERYSNLSVHGS